MNVYVCNVGLKQYVYVRAYIYERSGTWNAWNTFCEKKHVPAAVSMVDEFKIFSTYQHTIL